jgi:rubrerythrin
MHSEHHHHHHQHHDTSGDLTFAQRLAKILSHWKAHTTDHAATYRTWAEKAAAEGLSDAAALLEEAAEKTLRINETFEKAIRSIPESGPERR